MIASPECTYRYATFRELEVENSATAQSWLAEDELALWEGFRSDVRKHSFLAGRVLAKQLLQDQHGKASQCHPRQISIRSKTVGNMGQRPGVWVGGSRLDYEFSISHTHQSVVVTGTNRCGFSVGVDLVNRRSLGPAFERSWLTEAESTARETEQCNLTVADVWAMKEAVYKACNRGEPFAPRRVEIVCRAEGTTVRFGGHDLSDRCYVRAWRSGEEIIAMATYQRFHEPNDLARALQNTF